MYTVHIEVEKIEQKKDLHNIYYNICTQRFFTHLLTTLLLFSDNCAYFTQKSSV